MHFHWQNLNRDKRDKVKGWPWEGRCWFYPLKDRIERLVFEFDWYFGRPHGGGAIEFSCRGNRLQFQFSIGVISLWFSAESYKWRFKDREVSIKVHDNALWWNFWTPGWGWSRETPKYRNGCFHVDDFLFGKMNYHMENEKVYKDMVIPMPEGAYPCTIKMYTGVWKRPRWFAERIEKADVTMHRTIPHAGKGENAWDCGEDALYGWNGRANNIEDAIAEVVRDVLRDRRRYNGDVMAYFRNFNPTVATPTQFQEEMRLLEISRIVERVAFEGREVCDDDFKDLWPSKDICSPDEYKFRKDKLRGEIGAVLYKRKQAIDRFSGYKGPEFQEPPEIVKEPSDKSVVNNTIEHNPPEDQKK